MNTDTSTDITIDKIDIINSQGTILKVDAINKTIRPIGDSLERVEGIRNQSQSCLCNLLNQSSFEPAENLQLQLEQSCDLYELEAEYQKLSLVIQNETFSKSFYLDINEFALTPSAGANETIRISAELARNDRKEVLTRAFNVTVLPLRPKLPASPGWYAGDQHVHSNHTGNPIDLYDQPPIPDIVATSRTLGLDWVIIADHSTDLDANEWGQGYHECENETDPGTSVCLYGEEVSVDAPGPCDERHYLAYNITSFVPGCPYLILPPCPCWNNNPGAQDVIDDVDEQGGIGFIAHPHISIVGWDDWNTSGFTGIEIWNGGWDDTDAKAIINTQTATTDSWSEFLKAETNSTDGFVVGIGNSDAHSLESVGKTFSYCYLNALNEQEIIEALKAGRCVVSNGPFISFSLHNQTIGSTVPISNGSNPTLEIAWNSTSEFGNVTGISIYRDDTLVFDDSPLSLPTYGGTELEGSGSWVDESGVISMSFYRIEAETDLGRRAYTNPIWVEVVNDTSPPIVTITAPLNGSIVSTPNVTVSGFATDDVGIVTLCYDYSCETDDGADGGCQDLVNVSTTVSFNETLRLSPGCWYRIEVVALDRAGNPGNATLMVFYQAENQSAIFDTTAGTYPSISGIHNGTITPNQTLLVSALYTYANSGTGGHTEYVKIWNVTWNATARWNGYQSDWQNLSFNTTFTLVANETYNYTIQTGSYPQIIHERAFNATGGTITCTEFVDANGRKHNNWIPAIKLFSD